MNQSEKQSTMNEGTNIDCDVRFKFGQNWSDYSKLIDNDRIQGAQTRLEKFLAVDSLKGLSFLDIGCGSGIHALAALRLGANPLIGIDLDSKSIATTEAVLKKYWLQGNYTIRQQSVFDLDPKRDGTFDIVYSWGVLHHTGDMFRAIHSAARMVKPGGKLAIALYGKTRYCSLWTRIKRWYVKTTPRKREFAERLYVILFGLYLLLRGKTLSQHLNNYQQKRGMDFYHDVRDWIGGYPYESITPKQLHNLLESFGFRLVRENIRRRSGLFGSGNDEYVFERISAV